MRIRFLALRAVDVALYRCTALLPCVFSYRDVQSRLPYFCSHQKTRLSRFVFLSTKRFRFPQSHHTAHQSARKAKVDGVALLTDLAGRAGAADPLAVAQEIDMIMEGALITQQVAPDCDVCAIARRVVETLPDKNLPTSV